MTKDHTILSIQITLAEMAAFEAEAQAPPFLGNKSKYGRSIIEGRHKMQIVASPETRGLTEQHEQQTQQLRQDFQAQLTQQQQDSAQQVSQLKAELVRSAQALADYQQELESQQRANRKLQGEYKQLESDYINSAVAQHMGEIKSSHQADEDAKALATARQEAIEWKNNCQKEKEQVKTLKQELDQANKRNSSFERTVRLAEDHSDKVVNFAENLFGGKSGGLGTTPLREETELGRAIKHDFPGEQFVIVKNFLRYLRDTPLVKKGLFASSEFVAYQARQKGNSK